jgi:hypothetical protein
MPHTRNTAVASSERAHESGHTQTHNGPVFEFIPPNTNVGLHCVQAVVHGGLFSQQEPQRAAIKVS